MKRITLKNLYLGLSSKGLLTWIPDKTYLKILWRLAMKSKLNINQPLTFNEKLQWLKLFDRNPQYTQLVDKFAVREYIKKEIGEHYLIPLIGAYDNVNEIDWNKLPDQFVLKCNHDSGSTILCTDKKTFDRKKATHKLNVKMKQNTTYNQTKEWPYKNIKRKILCEQYIKDVSNNDLYDYKIFCFNGVPKTLFVATGRHSGGEVKFDFFDIDFTPLHIIQHHPESGKKIEKPKTFSEMISIAKRLSQGLPHVRVDLYEVNGQVYFGELTFFHHSGIMRFSPNEVDVLWGSWINLPQRRI